MWNLAMVLVEYVNYLVLIACFPMFHILGKVG